jgi:hypothetical protein
VGAAVKEIAPGMSLWGSTYRANDGIGLPPGPGLFLLQCSPAEDHVHGISTRVSRTMLAAYLEDPNLALWENRALFVLVGPSAASFDASALPESGLWAVRPSDLAQITDRQGRGTINSEALESLIGEGHAIAIASFLRNAASDRTVEIGSTAPQIGRLEGHLTWAGYGFGLNRPTPLGLAIAEIGNAIVEPSS